MSYLVDKASQSLLDDQYLLNIRFSPKITERKIYARWRAFSDAFTVESFAIASRKE